LTADAGQAARGDRVARRSRRRLRARDPRSRDPRCGRAAGRGQSGQIHEVGFALYLELLERAVTALRAGRVPDLEKSLHHGPEMICTSRHCCRSLSCRMCTRVSCSTSASRCRGGDRARRSAKARPSTASDLCRLPPERPVPHRAHARNRRAARH
jgi:hypothetical protein